ncbi:MAG: AAA family ATPase [Myxococcota bacterium]
MRERLFDAAGLSAEAARLTERLLALVGALAPPGVTPPQPRPSTEAVTSSRLDALVRALGLSPIERDLVLLAGLPEEDERTAAALRLVHPRGDPRPTAGLALQLLCRSPEERWLAREVLERGAAVRHGVLSLAGAAPFVEQNLVLADALWPALQGLEVWPASLRAEDGEVVTSGLEDWLAAPAQVEAARWLEARTPVVLLVQGHSEEVAWQRARALVHHAHRRSVALEPRATWTPELELLTFVHAAAREALPVLLCRADAPGASLPSCARAAGPVVLCSREGAAGFRGSAPVLQLRVGALSAQSRAAVWRAELPELAEHAASLAARYQVEPTLARQLARDVHTVAALEGRTPSLDDVTRAVRARSNVATGAGVKLMVPQATWDELVLLPDAQAKLREAVGRLTHQATVLEKWGLARSKAGARGVRMLFTGPPGTGKSLSAEVVAHALGVDVLTVDISRVVSKWLGETEKNLAALFDAAERAQAVLFFDEADALFGARTEVSDAHDRYANLETAYLLARLERFEGLAILATNLKDNIDPAFLRRIEFVVDFEEPGLRERCGLWRAHLPKDVPLHDDVDLDELAAFYPLVGALIRNAAMAAAFLAARADSPITRAHLLHAIRREFEKSGKAFPGEPFLRTTPEA